MKPRARRITIVAAVLAVLLGALLVVTHWGTVRDHVEAWHFQLTRETVTIEPLPEMPRMPPEEGVLHYAADRFRCPVIFDPEEVLLMRRGLVSSGSITEYLQAYGWRILEQRFPRRAYVVIRDADQEPAQTASWPRQSRLYEKRRLAFPETAADFDVNW